MQKAIIIKEKPVVKLCVTIWLLETENPNGFCSILAGDKNIIGNKLIYSDGSQSATFIRLSHSASTASF